MAEAKHIRLKRGQKANLPTLLEGEQAFITDEEEIYIGTATGNKKMTRNSELIEVESQLAETMNKTSVTLTHQFEDNTARDTYFTANPTELAEQLFIKVGTGYQQRLNGVWEISSPVLPEAVNQIDDTLTGSTDKTWSVNKITDAISKSIEFKKYGVRRVLGSTSPLLDRIHDSIGKVANMPIDGSAVQNDFDNIYPYSHIKECIRDDTGRYHYKGDPSYLLAVGDHLVEIPQYYIKIEQTETYRDYVICQYKQEGFWLPKVFLREDGTELDKIYVGQYKTGKADEIDVSRPDLVPENYRHLESFRTAARAKGEGWQLIDVSYVTEVLHTLYMIEYASLYSQDKLGAGITSMRYVATDTAQITETEVNRFVALTTVASNFAVGQQIGIGTSLGSNNVTDKRNITAINAIDGTTSEIVFDGTPVNIMIGNIIWNSAQKTGQTKDIVSSSSKLSGINGKTSLKYRGIEDPFGNVYEWVDGVLINDLVAHICNKPSMYASTITDDYKALNYTNHNENGYPLEMGYDNNYPEALFPILIGAGTTTGYTDYYYQNTGLRGAYFGGGAYLGSYAGLFYWSLGYTPTGAYWTIGARLLFKPPVY